MEQGNIGERYLVNSVLNGIKKFNKELIAGANLGNDFSNIAGIITADGFATDPFVAWNKAMNNFLCSGGIIKGARLDMILPKDTKDSHIKKYMSVFCDMSEKDGVQILGGHTEICGDIIEPKFIVNLVGKEEIFRQNKKDIKAGYEIVMTKSAAILGTNILLDKYYEKLSERFSNTYISESVFSKNEYSIKTESEIIRKMISKGECNICYMHDVSSSGIFAALWQLGKWMDKGFLVDHRKIDVRQSTIEICEELDINPYMIDGTGAMLIVAKSGDELVRNLAECNIKATIIGQITDDKEKIVVVNGVDKRRLAPVIADEVRN